MAETEPARPATLRDAGWYVLVTVLAMLVQGYHPGLEDDSFYLAAIRRDLNPALYPHDADFFQLQFQATIFDRLVTWMVRLTHLPLEWVTLGGQFLSILLILWACGRIAGYCFQEIHARWAAVALVAALLTIPVSGTGLLLVDQYLNPRASATAAILWAVVATLERRRVAALVLLAAAASLHVIMAVFGVSCCLFLAGGTWTAGKEVIAAAMALALPLPLPLGWLFEPASPAWRGAASTRTFYFPARWEWYEWLGVVAPLGLFWVCRAVTKKSSPNAAGVATSIFWYGLFQLPVALAILLPPSLERLRPFEPMRYLHLIYLFLFLLGGGLIGKYLLGTKAWRWAALFTPLCCGMLYAQYQLYPATPHLELPGAGPENEWVRAFEWVRDNTPQESLFALDPRYMESPGEDFHGFRALAERSALADDLKDPGMVARVPRLARRWLAESNAQHNWRNFTAADFRRLKQTFGVDWVVLAKPGVSGLNCPWREAEVLVCRLE